MQHLLDVVAHLPAVLAQYDMIRERDRAGSALFMENLYEKELLWANIAGFERQLRQWRRDWADQYPAGLPREVDSQGRDPFPSFRCRDVTSGEIIQPRTIVYPDPQFARTFCMYYASFLTLSSVDTRPKDMIQADEQYLWACLIWRSMEYYVRNAPGNLINRMAFSASVAYRALPEGGPEQESAGEIFAFIERKKKLKSWKQIDTNLL